MIWIWSSIFPLLSAVVLLWLSRLPGFPWLPRLPGLPIVPPLPIAAIMIVPLLAIIVLPRRPIPLILVPVLKLVASIIAAGLQIIEKVVLVVLLSLLVPESTSLKLNLQNVINIIGLFIEFGVGRYSLDLAALLVAPRLHLDQRDGLLVVVGGFVQPLYDLFVLQDQLHFVVEEV
jgi:hypothetical protein